MRVEHEQESSAKRLAETLAKSEDKVAASLNRIVTHCASEFGCSQALVTALDETGQYVLASSGAEEKEAAREIAFCHHAIASGAPLLVTDASRDERFQDSPLVKSAPYIRSYIGVPIKDPDGQMIGTICMVDFRAGFFSGRELRKLTSYGRGAEDLLRLHSLHAETQRCNAAIEEKNAQLADANRMFREAEKTAKFGAWQLEIETDKLTWSDGVYAIHGVAPGTPMTVEEAIDFYEESDRARVTDCVARAVSTGKSFQVDANLIAADGVIKRVRSRGKVIPASENFPARLTGIFKDITESYQSEVALRHAAEHDSLTELYNRYAFDRLLRDRLSSVKASSEDLYLLLIDLDGFKDVNDTFGHMVGDIVLEETGRRIADTVPEGCFAARWGGDEFAMVLPQGIDRKQAEEMGNDILHVICQRTEVADHFIDVSATAGLVNASVGINAKEFVRRADTALFFGKKREPGTVHFYSEEVERKNFVRQRAITEVRKAIEDNRLYAGYQPVVDLRSGRVVGFEALMRLNTSDGRRLTASEVLPALLDTKLSREVCRCMLDMVSNEAERLEKCAPGMTFLSINASEADLLSGGFADRFASTMDDAGVELSRLTLEVTETVLLVDNSQPVQQVLWALRERGVKIALDDFGTGYSSLSHLRDFPIDKVKIDRSFVRALNHEHQSRTIVQALVGMAMSLDIDVIAEGIETGEQLALLKQMGCRYGQGFLFGAAQDIGRLELSCLNNQAVVSALPPAA